jgi:hypothetical protein
MRDTALVYEIELPMTHPFRGIFAIAQTPFTGSGKTVVEP